MIPKSWNCFSDKIMRQEKHDPEKLELLFGKDRFQLTTAP